MRTKRSLVAAFVLAASLAGLGAAAGVVVEQEQREPGGDLLWKTTLYLDAGRLRVEAENSDGGRTITIFDSSKQVLWVIDAAAGTYYEMTAAQVREMGGRLGEARKQMEAQLATMPPEQRQALEAMMKQQMGRAAETTVREVGRGEAIGRFVCIHYEELKQGRRSNEVWTASLEQLQVLAEEYKTYQALARFVEPLGQGAAGGGGFTPANEKFEGFPVRTLTYDGGRVIAEAKVLKAERQTLDPKLFLLPPDLEKTSPEMQ